MKACLSVTTVLMLRLCLCICLYHTLLLCLPLLGMQTAVVIATEAFLYPTFMLCWLWLQECRC